MSKISINKILWTGDVHARTGPRGEFETSQRLLQSIGQTAKREECDTILINGDLWDEKHGVITDLQIMVWGEVQRWARVLKKTVLLVRGNHEIDGDKNRPEETSLLQLYHQPEAGIFVVNQATRLPLNGGVLWILPWYQPDVWLSYSSLFAQEAKESPGFRVFISHIGLKEGTVSSSNIYTVNQITSIRHIKPEVYDWVLLNDYHVKQEMAPNALYSGCPIPLAQGDAPSQGVMTLDLRNLELCDVELEGVFPRYATIRLPEHTQVPMVFANPQDYVKVQCPLQLVDAARALYPHPRWEFFGYALDNKIPLAGSNRLENVNKNDYVGILNTWLTSKQLNDSRYRNTAMQYLLQAEGVILH